jgi:hypothetical protein
MSSSNLTRSKAFGIIKDKTENFGAFKAEKRRRDAR